MSRTLTDLGGLKEGQLEISSPDAFQRLRWESGVHRVQRVPVNDVKLQTSAATVAVMPDTSTPELSEDTIFPPQVG